MSSTAAPHAEHYERFEVVTSADGGSCLHFDLACATALEHYQQTTTLQKEKGHPSGGVSTVDGSEDVCSTGLRVYEGAQVLAAFLWRYGLALSPLAADGDGESAARLVVELGCGCGLAGFTASSVFSAAGHSRQEDGAPGRVDVVFTDASEACLHLVRRTGERNALPVADGLDSETDLANCERFTFPLLWEVAGVRRLQEGLLRRIESGRKGNLGPSPPHSPAVGLVLGSDILYYRVDIHALLTTVKQLLLGTSSSGGADGGGSDGICVLCHAVRIADGRRQLAQQARRLGFGLAKVPLRCFLSQDDVVLGRGWGGLEVVLLFLKHSRDNNKSTNNSIDNANGREGHATGEGGRVEEEKGGEALLSVSEVGTVKDRLTRRIACWQHELLCRQAVKGGEGSPSAPALSRKAMEQAEALKEALSPYIYTNAEAADEELLHLLL